MVPFTVSDGFGSVLTSSGHVTGTPGFVSEHAGPGDLPFIRILFLQPTRQERKERPYSLGYVLDIPTLTRGGGGAVRPTCASSIERLAHSESAANRCR